jgi:hypothetical protein
LLHQTRQTPVEIFVIFDKPSIKRLYDKNRQTISGKCIFDQISLSKNIDEARLVILVGLIHLGTLRKGRRTGSKSNGN